MFLSPARFSFKPQGMLARRVPAYLHGLHDVVLCEVEIDETILD